MQDNMGSPSHFENLKTLIKNDKLSEVIEILNQNIATLKTTIAEEELLQINARVSTLNRERNLGIISNESYNLERNKLRNICSSARQ